MSFLFTNRFKNKVLTKVLHENKSKTLKFNLLSLMHWRSDHKKDEGVSIQSYIEASRWAILRVFLVEVKP